jgi:surfactin synthase thioesterase subunit
MQNGQTAIPGIQSLAERLYGVLAKAPPGPVAFFGHSMGALVAFEVARRFESAGNPISALFVSACAAPGRMKSEYFRDLSDDDLMKFLIEISGTDPRLLDNTELVDLILPAVRGYYNAIAGYTCPDAATVSCPIYAFVGTDDGLATDQSMAGWSAHTTADFSLRVFAGNHFYFAEHIPDLVAEVETKFGGQPV